MSAATSFHGPIGLRPRSLVFWILLAVGGRALLDLEVGSRPAELWQRTLEVVNAVVTAAVVLQFSPGDPPRRPWVLLAAAMALIPIIRLLSHLGLALGDVAASHVLLILGNVVMAASILDFGHVLGSSELLGDRTREDRVRATAFIAALALGALAPIVYNTWGLAVRGPPTTLGAWFAAAASGVSTLCDALVFAGGLYLLWLVRPLMGGSLARPYLLIAVGAGAFLVVDMFLVALGATTQTELVATSLHTLVPKWIGCLAFTGFALAAATQVALLRAALRR